jgi:hypothetical protein
MKRLVKKIRRKHFSCQVLRYGMEKISGVVGYRGNISNNPDADLRHDSRSLLLGSHSGCRFMGTFDELDLADRNWLTGYGGPG